MTTKPQSSQVERYRKEQRMLFIALGALALLTLAIAGVAVALGL